ncbi:MAG: DNA polymerase I [Lachnospiraceae bacterium]|nr:DNA polymerase I [Lachnospiraceae bacterium]
MREKIVLIDGHSILNRAFYGLPDLTNSEGLHTNAVYGFLNILFKILEEEKPQYLTVAFDLHGPTFRHVRYEAYKGTRKAMPAELRQQVPLIQEVLRAMHVTLVTLEGYEADDILGTIARSSEQKGLEVTIVSGDRDLLQLATDQVQIRIPKTRMGQTTVENYRRADVVEKYQLLPSQFIELKALMGDTADNIPGIPGVGEKTATKILLQYENIENAYAHVDEMKPNKAQQSLREHYDLAKLSKELATICVDAPVTFELSDARYENLYTPEAYEIFRRLDFKNLLLRFEEADTPQKEQLKIRELSWKEALGELNRDEKKITYAGVALLMEESKVRGFGAAFSREEIIYVPVTSEEDLSMLAEYLNQMFQRTEQICLSDIKQFLPFMNRPDQKRIFDVKLAAYLINPLKSRYTYDDIAKEFADEVLPSTEELFGSSKVPRFDKADPGLLSDMCGYTAYSCLCSQENLKEKLATTGMWKLYEEIEVPLAYTLYDMECAGIQAEAKELQEYGDRLKVRIGELERTIYEKAGEEFNINSPKQMGVVLFEKLKLPGAKKTKSGYSTAADVLDKLAPDYPIVAEILEYRQLSKLKSTYADGLAAFIGEDGRIHSRFHQTITATGRISSTEPNLQNIPIRMELGRMIRKVFTAKEGCVFIDADYSQIELRVLAHLSGDERLIQAYREARDIHRITASQVFHIPFDEVTPLQRRNAKAVNFGIVYGISSFGLSQDLSITRKEAADYIQNYFETYPRIKEFLDDSVEQAKKDGYVTTMFGRRRPVPELKSSNFMQRSFGERVAMNSPIQGTAADIIKIAMIRVDERLRRECSRAKLILQVHDELLIEAPKEDTQLVCRLLEEEMKGAADLAVALEVDMHTGENWYDAK